MKECFNALSQSLRLRLLVSLMVCLSGILAVNISLARRNAIEMADIALNRSLDIAATTIAEDIHVRGLAFDISIPPAALAALSSTDKDITYFRVTGPRELLAGYSDLPVIAPPLSSGPKYADARYHGSIVRLVSLRQVFFNDRSAVSASVTVGETLHARDLMVSRLERQAVFQQLALAIIATIIAWLSLRRDLAPLVELARQVRERAPGDLTALNTGEVQREFWPFIKALNAHFALQSQVLEAQRRFTANAAHQLRTPLTLLSMQAHHASHELDADKRQDAIVALATTTTQMIRLAKQLLRLSEAESPLVSTRRTAVDFGMFVRTVLEECAPLAISRSVELGFENQCNDVARVLADPTLLREMILNVVDNAIRYIPVGGTVAVSVSAAGGSCALRVEDNGPGIPATERSRVFERFYRILDNGGEGSGLGLAIVREIVQVNGGTIALSAPATSPGLVVHVHLPCIPVGDELELHKSRRANA